VTAEGNIETPWVLGVRWIPGIGVDRAKLRTTAMYQFSPTFSAGVEYNPLASDVGPLANWLAIPETGNAPALIFGTSSDRIGTPFGRIDWGELRRLDFEPPDLDTFRGLGLAYAAGRLGGTGPAWLNAANEVAVEAFLAKRIGFLAIARLVEATLAANPHLIAHIPTSVEDVLAIDQEVRVTANALLGRSASAG
jgi:hypothetical protein